ncbi:MAG TPA: hypothetical protein VGM82_24495 [Gemmatimonadaceae bacterium]|jgi:hypothetical protein
MSRAQWEYMILDVSVAGFWMGPDLDGEALTAKLNELGAEGWEALGLTGMAIRPRAYEGSHRDPEAYAELAPAGYQRTISAIARFIEYERATSDFDSASA